MEERERGRVIFAGSSIFFCLGLYTSWSVLAGGLIKDLGWTITQATFPLTIDMMVFGVSLIIGGRINDRYGPNRGSLVGGIIAGFSFILFALLANPAVLLNRYLVGGVFGFFSGLGSALIFSVIQPTLVKWYPLSQRGRIIGFINMIFQAASLFWAFFIGLMLISLGVRWLMIAIGTLFILVFCIMSRILTVPDHYTRKKSPKTPLPSALQVLREIVANPLLIIVCLIYISGKFSVASLISHLNQIMWLEFKITHGYVFVSLFSICTTMGTFLGGFLVDRKNEIFVLKMAFLFISLAMILFLWTRAMDPVVIIIPLIAATAIMGLNQGATNTSISVLTANIFGVENFGMAFGVIAATGSFLGPLGGLLFGWWADRTGSYLFFFVASFIISIFGYGLTLYIGRKKSEQKFPGQFTGKTNIPQRAKL